VVVSCSFSIEYDLDRKYCNHDSTKILDFFHVENIPEKSIRPWLALFPMSLILCQVAAVPGLKVKHYDTEKNAIAAANRGLAKL
jgi:hypothetical protein